MVKPSHADAARSASGLLSFAVIVSDYWGSTDFTGTDLENDDALLSWLNRLEAAIPTYGDAASTPLDILLAQPRIDIVQTTAAEVSEKRARREMSSRPAVLPNPGRGGRGRSGGRRSGTAAAVPGDGAGSLDVRSERTAHPTVGNRTAIGGRDRR